MEQDLKGHDERRAPLSTEEDAAVLSAVLEAAAEGILVVDADGIIHAVNPAGIKMFGYQGSELLGKSLRGLMPQHYAEAHDGFVKRYLATGQARIIGIGREVEGLRKDGTVFPLGLAIGEVKLPGRRLFAGIVRDLSEQRDAESKARARLHELAHASRLLELGEMTSELGHEINQPLTAIVTFAQACRRMLANDNVTPEVLENTLSQIVTQGERAAEIVRGLRDFASKHTDEREVVVVSQLIEDVVTLLGHELRRHGTVLELRIPQTVLEIWASRIQIEQVLVNLVRNAVDAMESLPRGQRSLRLAVSAAGADTVEMTVEDSGTGITSENLERLFDAYFTTKSDGMGVGLAISKTIITSHGGTIEASNRVEGGAQFVVRLPQHQRPAPDG